MKVMITYEETVSYTQPLEIEDADFERFLDGREPTGDLVKEYYTRAYSEWEEDLMSSRTRRDTVINSFDIYITAVDLPDA